MTPADEAAQIITRVLESLARASNKTLKASTRADIARACSLLADGAAEYDQLEDLPPMPRVSPAEAVMEFAEKDPGYKRWKEEREKQ